MNFASAIFAMECGRKVRRHHWSGYWKIKNGEIIICYKDREVLNLRHSGDIIYILKNTACDDWEIVPNEDCFNNFWTADGTWHIKLSKLPNTITVSSLDGKFTHYIKKDEHE